MRKLLLAAIAVILFVAAVPASAQLDGNWKGTGDGFCPPPPAVTSDFPIYAWQSWTGETKDDVFRGRWCDKTGNYGNFEGEILWVTEEEAYCEGTWTWFYVTSDEITEYDMGRFNMCFEYFPVETPYCYGLWATYSGVGGGGTEGRMIF